MATIGNARTCESPRDICKRTATHVCGEGRASVYLCDEHAADHRAYKHRVRLLAQAKGLGSTSAA